MVGREAFAEALLGLLDMNRKGLAQRALAEIVRSMRWDGSCPLSRAQLVAKLGAAESNVSAALTELADLGVIIRESDGRNRLKIRVNPLFASMLRSGERSKAQAEAPPIRRRHPVAA